MIIGACAGSTSGLKLMRIRIGLEVAFRELAHRSAKEIT